MKEKIKENKPTPKHRFKRHEQVLNNTVSFNELQV